LIYDLLHLLLSPSLVLITLRRPDGNPFIQLQNNVKEFNKCCENSRLYTRLTFFSSCLVHSHSRYFLFDLIHIKNHDPNWNPKYIHQENRKHGWGAYKIETPSGNDFMNYLSVSITTFIK
jgi:hypothetical protein